MKRRTLLAAGSAALLPVAAGGLPGATETPVRRLYRDWKAAFDRANDRRNDEDETARLIDIANEIEARLDVEPSQSIEDLALKIRVASGPRWIFAPAPKYSPGLCAEVEALAGVTL